MLANRRCYRLHCDDVCFRFVVVNAGITYLYFSSFQQIDEEEYGGMWELTKEGFMTSFAGFLVSAAESIALFAFFSIFCIRSKIDIHTGVEKKKEVQVLSPNNANKLIIFLNESLSFFLFLPLSYYTLLLCVILGNLDYYILGIAF